MTRRDRERELARRRYERRQQRREAQRARARRRNAIVATVMVVLLLLVGGSFAAARYVFNGDDNDDTNTLAQPTPAASATGPLPCAYKTSGKPAGSRKVTPPSLSTLDVRHVYTATMKTTRGTIAFRMPALKAPCTVNSFRSLAGQQYFDGTQCHRLTTTGIFVLQCGDPSATGSGGPGYSFPDENLTGATYKAGTVAMANSGPNTNGSQFFLVYKDTQLPPSYTPFGSITSGLGVVQAIAKAGSQPTGDGKPKQKVVIQSFTVAVTG